MRELTLLKLATAAIFILPTFADAQEVEQVRSLATFGDWRHARLSPSPLSARIGMGGRDMAMTQNEGYESLSISCFDAGHWAISLMADTFLGWVDSEETVWRRVTYRFDGGEPSRRQWILDESDPYAGTELSLKQMVGSSSVRTETDRVDEYRSFVTQAQRAQRVNFRIFAPGGTWYETSFSLDGFSDAYAGACGS